VAQQKVTSLFIIYSIHVHTVSGDILHTANWFSYQLSDSATHMRQYIRENVYSKNQEYGNSKDAGAPEHILGLASMRPLYEDNDNIFQGPGARRDFSGPMSKTRLPRTHEQDGTSQGP
jgi:hypothetical protein